MSNTKHTKAPWELSDGVLFNRSNRDVAYLIYEQTWKEPTEEEKANEALLLNAPELLALSESFLESYLLAVENLPPLAASALQGFFYGLSIKAQEIIQKAKGEA